MLQLPNGCYCSNPTISPADWKRPNASLKRDWYIQYYFYDPSPAFKETFPNGKLVIVKKGINRIKSVSGRQAAIAAILDHVLHNLQEEGFNPWTGKATPVNPLQVLPGSAIIYALEFAMTKAAGSHDELRSVMRQTQPALQRANLAMVPVKDFSRRHVRILLETIQKIREEYKPTRKGERKFEWTANSFNYYRAHLSILFNVLVDHDVIEANPVKGISKQKYQHKLRELLTDAERTAIDQHLKTNHYRFWRLVIVFYHLGGRETELAGVQARHVDLLNQRVHVLIKKGHIDKWVWKTIKDHVLPLWKEIMNEIETESDYLFSRGLKPGPDSINAEQISRRWTRYVKAPVSKGGLGIKKDFYALKHLNLDETAAIAGIKVAADAGSHTTPVITLKHYALGEERRSHEALKKINNTFGKNGY